MTANGNRQGPVVVSSDGADHTRGAIRFAVFEAALRNVPVDVVSSAESDVTDRVISSDDLMEGADGYEHDHSPFTQGRSVRTALAVARRQHPRPEVTVAPAVGSVIKDLRDRSSNASMVVLGVHDAGLPNILGSPALAWIVDSGCPVALVPGGWTEQPVHHRIAVGVDGSPTSARAADFATEEAEYRGVPVELFHAWNHDDLVTTVEGRHGGPLTMVRDMERTIAATQAAKARDVHPAAHITSVEITGDPTDALRNVADRVDALVIGRWRHPGVPEWASSRPTARFLSTVRCPLIIVA